MVGITLFGYVVVSINLCRHEPVPRRVQWLWSEWKQYAGHGFSPKQLWKCKHGKFTVYSLYLCCCCWLGWIFKSDWHPYVVLVAEDIICTREKWWKFLLLKIAQVGKECCLVASSDKNFHTVGKMSISLYLHKLNLFKFWLAGKMCVCVMLSVLLTCQLAWH